MQRPGTGAGDGRPRLLLFDTDALLELGRDGNLVDALVDAQEHDRYRVVVTFDQAQDLEQATSDMACAAQAQLERLPTALVAAGAGVVFVSGDPRADERASASFSVEDVWTLDGLRERLSL